MGSAVSISKETQAAFSPMLILPLGGSMGSPCKASDVPVSPVAAPGMLFRFTLCVHWLLLGS